MPYFYLEVSTALDLQYFFYKNSTILGLAPFSDRFDDVELVD